MKKFLIFLSILLLSGCSFSSGSLLSLPRSEAEYGLLGLQLGVLNVSGARYTSPNSGDSRDSTQYVDLDNDGVKEAVSFLLVEKNGVTTPYVYIYKPVGNGYKLMDVIEGNGETIDCAYFRVLNSEGDVGIILGWGMGSSLSYRADIYVYRGGKLKSLHSGTYSAIRVCDMTGDGFSEIYLLTFSRNNTPGRASVCTYKGGIFSIASSCNLSAGLEYPTRVFPAAVGFDRTALVVEGPMNAGGYVSDYLFFSGRRLVNVYYRTDLRHSAATYRELPLWSCDINGDGATEYPQTFAAPGNIDESEPLWFVNWFRSDDEGGQKQLLTTFLSISDRWYLRIPESLQGRITAEISLNEQGVRSVIFRRLTDEGELDAELWEIFRYIGPYADTAASGSGYYRLASAAGSAYAVRLCEAAEIAGVDYGMLDGYFTAISNSWLAENWGV